MTQQIAEILDRAAELIETKGWTQGAFARAGGKPVIIDHIDADCFCAVGAIHRSYKGILEYDANIFLVEVLCLSGTDEIFAWNDNPARTKDDVVAALKAAAQLARIGKTND